MKIAFYTLGCKTNQFETQALETLFEQRGHTIVPFDEFAHVYIVNTCTVTALSDKKSRNAARRCKKINPRPRSSSAAATARWRPEQAREMCGADIVVGTGCKGTDCGIGRTGSIPGLLLRRQRRTGSPEFEVLPAEAYGGRTRALLKVQDGCQNFCTYCIIPYARGRCRSIPLTEAVRQAASLEKEGYQEIVVTGIEVSSYGIDLPDHPSPAALLAAICQAAPHTRIRVGSWSPGPSPGNFWRRWGPIPICVPISTCPLQSGCRIPCAV